MVQHVARRGSLALLRCGRRTTRRPALLGQQAQRRQTERLLDFFRTAKATAELFEDQHQANAEQQAECCGSSQKQRDGGTLRLDWRERRRCDPRLGDLQTLLLARFLRARKKLLVQRAIGLGLALELAQL